MTISDYHHNLASSLALGIANLMMVTEQAMIDNLMGPDNDECAEPPEHFCALAHPEEVEELLLRFEDCVVSVKVGVKDVHYGLDHHVEEIIRHAQKGT